MKRFLLACFYLFLVTNLSAQSITISGRVTDEDTGEGVPFCNVYFKGTTTGVSSDVDGYYEISTKEPTDTLVASALGYDNFEKKTSGETGQKINFVLKSSDFTLDEVVVLAGENPANEVVRQIIKNKPNNRVESLDAFQCETYSKLELDVVNLDKEMRNTKLFKQFDFIFDYVDTVSDEKPFLPVYIVEQVDDYYYQKDEGEIKEITKAQRTSGASNATVVEFINKARDRFSIYDNWIPVMEKQFVSPFSNQGLLYYEYYILDSAYIEGQWSRKLKFKPKRKQEKTFYGDFWVADTSFAIQRVNMRMSPDVNINLVSRVIIYQDFHFHETQNWLPNKDMTVIDFVSVKNGPGMIGRYTASYKDYRIDHEQQPNIKERDPELFDTDQLVKDDSYWQQARHEKLSESEQSIYAMVDSIKNVPVYKTYVDILYTLTTGFKELGPVEIGPYFSIYNNNPVERHRFQMGVWTSNNFSKRIRFGGYMAYGTKDNRLKYGADLQWNLSKRPRIVVGAAYKDDVSFNSANSENLGLGEGNIFSGTFRRPILQKLLHVKEAKVFYERFWGKGWSTKFTVLNQDLDPYGGIGENGSGFNYQYLPNPESKTRIDTTIRTSEFIVKLRYAPGERFVEGNFVRSSLGSKKPIIQLQYTAGVRGIFGGEYNYHKFDLSYRHYFNINPIGWMSYRINAGKVFGEIPFLLMEVHPGNETFFYNTYAFNGMNRYEFASDAYVTLMVVHHFDGFFLNKIPLLRKLKWRSVASFRAVYGTISEDNQKRNQLNSFSDADLTTYTGFRAPSEVPYMEFGVGIENIFKIFRVGALWRLNYHDNPEAQLFQYQVGMVFYF